MNAARRPACDRRPVYLIEDVRFEHPVSGRRARRLVYTMVAAPLTIAADVSLLLVS